MVRAMVTVAVLLSVVISNLPRSRLKKILASEMFRFLARCEKMTNVLYIDPTKFKFCFQTKFDQNADTDCAVIEFDFGNNDFGYRKLKNRHRKP